MKFFAQKYMINGQNRISPRRFAIMWATVALIIGFSWVILVKFDLLGFKKEINKALETGDRDLLSKANRKLLVVNIIYGIGVSLLLLGLHLYAIQSFKSRIQLSYRCPKCGFVFKPLEFKSYSAYFIIYGPFHFLLHNVFRIPVFHRCPRCKKFSWCSTVKKEG